MRKPSKRRHFLALAMTCLASACIAEDDYIDVPLSGTTPEIAPFEVLRHEVTIGQYEACVAAGACDVWTAPTPPQMTAAPSQYSPLRLGGATVTYEAPDQGGSEVSGYAQHLSSGARDALPITFVSVAQALQYCIWQGGRLPDRLERGEMIRAFAASAAEDYRDRMRDGDQERLCRDVNLPHHDARVLIEQMGSAAPQDRIADKTVKLCQTGPSIGSAETATDIPTHLIGSVHEWTLRQPGGQSAFAAGGSWLNGEFVFEGGFDSQIDDTARRAVDVGFRCVRTAS